MSFAVYRPVRPSSSIDHAVRARFTTSKEDELIIARVSTLEVWRPPMLPSRAFAEYVTSYDLHGEINAIGVLKVSLDMFTPLERESFKMPESGLDILVLSFDEAKISFVCFDSSRPKTLRTLGLFNFEETAKQSELKASKAGIAPLDRASYSSTCRVIVDPDNRCVSAILYSSWVAVIPVRCIPPGEDLEAKQQLISILQASDEESSSSSSSDDDDDGATLGNGRNRNVYSTALKRKQRMRRRAVTKGMALKPQAKLKRECGNAHPLFGHAHLLPLVRFGIEQHSVLDARFLLNSPQPTLAVLHSQGIRSWAGRVGIARDSARVSAIVLKAENPLSASRIWIESQLPHDSQYIVPLSTWPSGGCLVVAANSLTFVSAVPSERYSMATNGFACVSCRDERIFDLRGNVVVVGDTRDTQLGTYAFDKDGDDEEDGTNVATSMEASTPVVVAQGLVVFALGSGTLFQVTFGRKVVGGGVALWGRVMGALPGVTSSTSGVAIPLSLTDSTEMCMFFGSRNADGVFIRTRVPNVLHPSIQVENGRDNGKRQGMFIQDTDAEDRVYNGKKRPKTVNDVDDSDDTQTEDYLYATSQTPRDCIYPSAQISVELVDFLPVLGPLIDMDFCDSLPTTPFKESGESDDQRKLAVAEKQAEELKAKKFFSDAVKVLELAKAEVEEDRRKRTAEALKRDVDLVACGARTRLGAPAITMQCGIRPTVRAESTIPECSLMFHVAPNILVVSESARTRVFELSSTEMVETETNALAQAPGPTLLVAPLVSAMGSVVCQVLPSQLLVLDDSASYVLQQIDLPDTLLIAQCCHAGDSVFLLGQDAKVSCYRLDPDSPRLEQFDLSAVMSGVDVACMSAFTSPTGGNVTLLVVRAGTGESEGGGIVECYEWTTDADSTSTIVRLVFRSHVPLALCSPVLASTVVATSGPSTANGPMMSRSESLDIPHVDVVSNKDSVARAGVLVASRVVDVLCSFVSDGVTTRPILVAALGDGDIVVYTKSRDSETVWTKVEHKFIARGLRGRVARKRKFPGIAVPQGKAFRGPLLFRVSKVEGFLDGAFFAGHRPCFVLASRGQISVVPLASSVSSPIPPPVAQAEDGTEGGGQTQQQQQPQHFLGQHHRRTPEPSDVQRCRGPVHALCGLGSDGTMAYVVRAPEGNKSTAHRPTVLRLCSVSAPLLVSRPLEVADIRGGIVVKRWNIPRSGWSMARLAFLSHASRGSAEETAQAVHATTLALINTKLESVRTSSDGDKDGMDVTTAENGKKDVFEPDERLGGAPDVVLTRQSVDVVRAPDLNKILTSFVLKPEERVLSMVVADLDAPLEEAAPGSAMMMMGAGQKQPRKRLQGMLILGTGVVDERGEEVSSEGRILVLAVDHLLDPLVSREDAKRIVTKTGRPVSKPSLRVVADVDLRGPVSAVNAMDGKIIAATGVSPCQLRLLELSARNEGLVPIGFYDAPTCVVSLSVIKDQYVLLSDLSQSVHLIRWKDREFKLAGKTIDKVRVFSSEVAVDGTKLMLCAGDDDANLRMWQLDPEAQLLRPRAELNIGVRVGKLRAKKMSPLPPRVDEGFGPGTLDPFTGLPLAQTSFVSPETNKWSVVIGTLAGGISLLQPVDEKAFRRLDLLQTEMIKSASVPRNAGLHPLQCAMARVPKRPNKTKDARFVVDGRIVWRFIDLEKIVQRKLALSIGSTVETIIDTLLEIDLAGSW